MDGIDLHIQVIIIERVNREDRFIGSWIQGDKQLIWSHQEGVSGIHPESEGGVFTQLLTENVLDVCTDSDPIGGLPLGGTPDLNAVSEDVHRGSRQGWFDAQHGLCIDVRINGVVKLDIQGCQGRAAIVRPGTSMLFDPQGSIGLEAEGLCAFGDQGTFR